MGSHVSTEDRQLLIACANGEFTWENSRPGFVFEQDHYFVRNGEFVGYEMDQELWGLVNRGLIAQKAPWVLLTDAGRAALR